MTNDKAVWQGTLALMVLKTLQTIGPLHGYGIARRIEQTSGDLLSVNYGTLYPALLKLEQEGYIDSEWGQSDNNRKAKYYRLTRAGRKQLAKEAQEWAQTTAILARFLTPGEDRPWGAVGRGLSGWADCLTIFLKRGDPTANSPPRWTAICKCTSTTTCV